MIEKILTSNTLYEGQILNLSLSSVLLPNLRIANREIIQHSNSVVVIAFDKDEQLILVKQYRISIGKFLFEFPAGAIENGENPSTAALRELREETGYEAKSLKLLGEFYLAPGFCTELMYVFLAENLILKKQQLDEDEFVDVVRFKLEKFDSYVKKGKIIDAKSIAARWMIFSNNIT